MPAGRDPGSELPELRHFARINFRGHDDDRQVEVQVLDELEKGLTLDGRKVEIEQNDVWRRLVDLCDRLCSLPDRPDSVFTMGEGRFQHCRDLGLIVHHKDCPLLFQWRVLLGVEAASAVPTRLAEIACHAPALHESSELHVPLGLPAGLAGPVENWGGGREL